MLPVTVKRLKEGATMFADLIEALPEAFAVEAFARDESCVAIGVGIINCSVEAVINDGRAVSWCAVGGVAAAAKCSANEARMFLRPFTGPLSVEDFNNEKGRQPVIKMLRRAAGER